MDAGSWRRSQSNAILFYDRQPPGQQRNQVWTIQQKCKCPKDGWSRCVGRKADHYYPGMLIRGINTDV